MKIKIFGLCAVLLLMGQSCKKVNCYRCTSPGYSYSYCANDASDTSRMNYNVIANGGIITDETGTDMTCTAYKK